MIDKKKLIGYLPENLREPLKRYLMEILNGYYGLRCLINRLVFFNSLLKTKACLHIGCGDIRIKNCLNLDYRATKATDLVCDCRSLSLFKEKTFTSVYSHAFFEHLYREQRIPLLQEVKRVLIDKGFVLFLGIPDFERVATAYLSKEKGLFSDIFDIYEVYRYTHGDPERYPSWWLQQLHKSLFDSTELEKLLTRAGFKHFIIFRYCFRSEHLPVSLGFYATISEAKKFSAKDLLPVIDRFTDSVNKKTITILRTQI